MNNRQKRKKRVAAYKATPIWERAHGNFDYGYMFDQGGRAKGLRGYDWQEGCDSYYDNHPIKGCTSSAIAYAKHGMEYDI